MTECPPLQLPLFKTALGRLYVGASEQLLTGSLGNSLNGKVDLIFTSPPFPLNDKKKYGNLKGEEYLQWLAAFGPIWAKLLSPRGSLVVEVGNAWEPGKPVQSTLPQRSLLALAEAGKFFLCQEITYYNPARLPSPAQWVTVNRIRLKDATTKIWWMSKSEFPDADNRRVLKPYSKHMERLLKTGRYNAGKRPSEHSVSKTGFLVNHGGAIAPNLITLSNTQSSNEYLNFCRSQGLKPHPARMPVGLADFFIRFLTSKGGLVLDPFAGSNTTGSAAEQLGRKWVGIEADATYAAVSIARFNVNEAQAMHKSG